MAVKIDSEKCTGCGVCKETCPVEAISVNDGLAVVEGGTCVECGRCVPECPNEAMSIPE